MVVVVTVADVVCIDVVVDVAVVVVCIVGIVVEVAVVVCCDFVVVGDVAVVVCIIGVVVGSMSPNATPAEQNSLSVLNLTEKPEAMPPVTMATMVRVTRSLITVASFADLIAVFTQQQRLWSMEATTPVITPAANT